MNYIDRQLEASACVPIAITNALIWSGRNESFYGLRETFIRLGWNPKSGANVDEIEGMLVHFKFGITRVENPSVSDLERYIDWGYGMLLSYNWFMKQMRPLRKGRGHLVFIDGHEGSFIGIKNANGNGSEYKPRLQCYLDKSRSYRGLKPVVWLLEKP